MSMLILDKDEWEDLVERVEELEKATYENESEEELLEKEDKDSDGEDESLKNILWSGAFSSITSFNNSFFISFLNLENWISPFMQVVSSYSMKFSPVLTFIPVAWYGVIQYSPVNKTTIIATTQKKTKKFRNVLTFSGIILNQKKRREWWSTPAHNNIVITLRHLSYRPYTFGIV